jgi:Uma2 family endonuclease
MSAITIDTRLVGGTFLEWAPKLRLEFRKASRLSDDEFFEFCRDNPDVRIEMDQNGDIEIMPPTGTETGGINFDLSIDFGIWARKDGSGKGFDSSTGFFLPNGARRSPDMSWVKLERWEALSEKEKKKFAPLCPDFVVEIRSESDTLEKLQDKMAEYMENGCSLGWLIDLKNKDIHVYERGGGARILNKPEKISGDPLLKGFTLSLKNIWK